jgi:hypothetical protein
MIKILSSLVIIFISSCSMTQKNSPVIYFSNASAQPITDINVIWTEDNILTLSNLNPGDSRSQSFYLSDNDDFFGLVKVSWTNGSGHGVSRDLFFRPNNLPSINDESTYNYVQIYLEQDDLEMMSSDAVDLASKTKRRDDLLTSYKNNYLHDSPLKIPTSLIRARPIKDSRETGWLTRTY